MKFGYFLAPYFLLGKNPTVSFERALDLGVELDKLGFDEIWIGEHHSGGFELITSPEVFVMALAERTRYIRLGTGVVSVPFHNPFHVASRAIMLDYLTRGRVTLGCGPGQLASDVYMLGMDAEETRPRLVEGVDIIRRLMSGETVTREWPGWFNLREARLQLAPFTPGGMPMAITGSVTPNGAKTAGRFGTGLLSMSATTPATVALLGSQWATYEQAAATYGHAADRGKWRLVGPMHLAATREQARTDMAYGMVETTRYFPHVAPGGMFPGATTLDEMLDQNDQLGTALIGTPEDAIDRIRFLHERSGGFGSYVILGTEWASPDATRRSLELFATYVAPHFKGLLDPPRRSFEWVDERAERFASDNARAWQASGGGMTTQPEEDTDVTR